MGNHPIILAAIIGAPPPDLFWPSFTQAILGWVMGVLILGGPAALGIASWQRRHGRWWHFFAQWNSSAFWMVLIGSFVAAFGMFGLLGMIPAWQNAWNSWYLGIVQSNPSADPNVLTWLQTMQQSYALSLQVTAGIVFLLGAAAVAIGQTRLARRMALFRDRGPDDWLVSRADIPVVTESRNPTCPVVSDPFN